MAPALFLLATLWTVLTVLTPVFRLDAPWPRGRPPLESAGVVLAGLTAALAYLNFSLSGTRTALFVALACLVLALNQLVFGLLVAASNNDMHLVYFWIVGRVLVAGLLLAGAAGGPGGAGEPRHPSREYLTRSTIVLCGLVAAQAALWLFRDQLPPLTAAPRGRVGALPNLSAIDLTLGAVGAILFFTAAIAYLWPARRRVGFAWLGPALVLAAFSHIHYMLLPTISTDRISAGDVLRFAFFVVLVVGLTLEVRTTFLSGRDRVRELVAAYRAERARVVELERLERANAEFFRIVTHELIHPISALRGWVVALLARWDDLSDEAKRGILYRLDVESRGLSDLTEGVATLAPLETPSLPLAVRKVAIVDLLRDAAGVAPDLDGRLRARIQRGLDGECVRADPARILQVFRNLMSNAVKYSKPGTVVGLRAQANGSRVIFSVTDQGPGIAPQDLGPLFRRFSRVPQRDGRAVPGSGLGLYTCRRIVAAHGGRIWAESRVGEGSTFSFTLPRYGVGA